MLMRGWMREKHLAQGKQRRLPQVVLNRRSWASFYVRLQRHVCQLRQFE